jgi:peptidoglycan hydrolase-like protein with peptidoglycan-binding domain
MPKKPSAKKKHHYARREPKQKAPTPERISEIQSALARNGYYQGNPNGKWDSNTIGAMQKFQSDHGLDATGKLDALSLQKLGLGSDIAGVSAPRPITPTSSSTPSQTTPPSAKPQQQAKAQ